MNDPTLVRLTKVIQLGWPETGKGLENDVKLYFQHRCELHIVDGIIFFQNRIVVPMTKTSISWPNCMNHTWVWLSQSYWQEL